MPPETLETYRNHGDPQVRIHEDLPGADAAFRQLGELGIGEEVFHELEEEGIRKFTDSYNAILQSIREKARPIAAG